MSNLVSSLLFQIEANTASLTQSLNETKGHVSEFNESLNKLKEFAIEAFAFESIKEGAEKVFEFTQEIGELTDKVSELSRYSGKDLVDLTASIKATSDTFGTDFNETLKTTNTLSKTMGISFSEASKLIQDGTSINHINAVDFLATVKEYSPQFKTLGLDASQSIALITNSLKNGLGTNGADAITKAHKNLEELLPTAVASLKAIGINADAMRLAIAEGSLTEFQAIQQISMKMKEFGDNSQEVGNVLINVFGKSGVKAGAQYIESLATMNLSTEDLVKNMDESEKANYDLAKANEELNKIWVQMFGNASTQWANIKTQMTEIAVKTLVGIKEGTIDIINYFIDLYNNSILFRAIIQDVVMVFKNFWEVVKVFATNFMDVFKSAGELIKDVFTGNFKAIPTLFASTMKTLAQNTLEFGKAVGNNFISGVKATLSTKKISLINENEVQKEGEQAGKTFASAFDDSLTSDSASKDKSSKGGKGKGKKGGDNGLGLDVDSGIVKKLASDFLHLKTSIAGAVQQAQYMPTTLQAIGDTFSKNISKTAYPAMMQLGDSIGQTSVEGKTALQSLGDSVENTAKSVLKSALIQAMAENIASNSDYPYPLDILMIGLGAASISALFSAIPSFATGGVSEGGMSLVGEQGAELVDLPAGSRIHNHGDTMKMFSGGGNKLQVQVVGMVRGEDIYYSQKEVVRRRGLSN